MPGGCPGGTRTCSIPMDVPEQMYKCTPPNSLTTADGRSSTEGEEEGEEEEDGDVTAPLRPDATNGQRRIVRSVSATGLSSPLASPGRGLLKGESGSPLSRSWRRRMNSATSLDHGLPIPTWRRRGVSECLDQQGTYCNRRRSQLGMAVLFNLDGCIGETGDGASKVEGSRVRDCCDGVLLSPTASSSGFGSRIPGLLNSRHHNGRKASVAISSPPPSSSSEYQNHTVTADPGSE